MLVPLVLFAVLPMAMGQFDGFPGLFNGNGNVRQLGRNKQGSCPPLAEVGICVNLCYEDYNCAGAQKCCNTACGGAFCINPVTPPRSTGPVVKAGACPKPSGPWVCSSRCRQDSDCRGKKKCCTNRCGAKACIDPEEDNSDNEIPLI